jgi:hypothetical protein
LSEFIVCLSCHTKSGKAARRLDVYRVDIIDASACRPSPYRHLEPLHRIGVPFGHDLDAAIMLVAHVSQNAFSLRRVFHEKSESDALHTPFDDVPAPHKHAELYKGRAGSVGGVGIVGAWGQRKKGASEAGTLRDEQIGRSVDL